MEERPNYYAIIPANVRYDETLRDKAKLLYGEITALCNKNGYCFASNKYFADLYGVTTTTISTLIKELSDRGYIESVIQYKEGTKEILNRYLKIFKEGIQKNLKDNNTSINNTSINKKEIYKERFIKPTLEEIEQYCIERNNNVDAKRFYDYYTIANWKDSKGNPVKNWKQKMIANWENKAKKESEPPLPKWFNQEYKESELSEDDERELQELIRGY